MKIDEESLAAEAHQRWPPKVNYVYLAAYRVLGISHPQGNPDLVLWERTNPVRRLVLTSRLDELFENFRPPNSTRHNDAEWPNW